MSYSKATLSNGMTLVVESHPHVRSVAIGVWVRVGSSFETPSQNGLSHFIEHMVFKGTERRSAFELATALESVGGDLNAFTDREFTCYHATVLNEDTELAVDVLSDLLTRPTFPAEELEREKKVLLQELSMIESAPDDYIGDVFFSTIWEKGPLGQPVIGSKQTIKSFTRAHVVNYFRDHYYPENIVIAVAGNVSADEIKRLCEKYFSERPRPKKKKAKRRQSVYQAKKKSIRMDTEQLHLLLGFEGTGFKDPNRFDALILSFFLGGGMSSRLFQEIREKAGLAYSVDCDCVPFSDTGIFSIYVATSPKSLKQCLEIIGREVTRLKETPLTAKELSIVKGQLRGTILLSNENMDARQESIGRNEVVFGRYVSMEEVLKELDEVSPERVQLLAQKTFIKTKQAAVTISKIKPKSSDVTIF